jgi:protein-disulfide isomerase-like protein with CxxC motif
MGRPHICSRIGVNHHTPSKHSKGDKLRSQYMTYLLNKYLAFISDSSHAMHVIFAARPLSLEGDFAFFENINERRAFRHF